MEIQFINKCRTCGFWTIILLLVDEEKGLATERCSSCGVEAGPILWNEKTKEIIEMNQRLVLEHLCLKAPELNFIQKPGDRVFLPDDYKPLLVP